MADEAGALSEDELEALNVFLNDNAGEEGLVCPVAGVAVPITEWHAPDRVSVLPGREGAAGLEVFPLTSPSGGVILISVAQVTAAAKDADKTDKAPEKQENAE